MADKNRQDTRRITPAMFDALVVVVVAIAAFLFAVQLDALETIVDVSRQYEYLELDEVFVALFVSAFALVWFAYRRAIEAQRQSEGAYVDLVDVMDQAGFSQLPLDNMEDALVIVDKDFRVTFFSKGAEELFGYSAQEALGQSGSILVPEDRFKEVEEFSDFMWSKSAVKQSFTVRRHKDGSAIDVLATLIPIRKPNQDPHGVWALYRDIRAEKNRERRLNLYKQVWDEVDLSVSITDETGRIADMNPAAETIFGLTREDMLGKKSGDLATSLSASESVDEVRESLRNTGVWNGEVEITRPDRSVRHLRQHNAKLTDEDGNITGGLSIAMDITDERERKRNLELYKTVWDSVDMSVSITNDKGLIAEMNPASEQIFGLSRDKMIGAKPGDLAQLIDGDTTYAEMRRCIMEAGRWDGDVSFTRQDGEVRHAKQHIATLNDETGKIIGGLSITMDITDARERERTLLLYKKVWDSVDVSVFITDPEGRVIDFNPATQQIFGLDREEIIGQRPTSLLEPANDDIEAVSAKINQGLRKRGRWEGEFSFKRNDGYIRTIQQTIITLRDDKGVRMGGLALSVDVTERKQAEQAQKESEERFRSIFEQADVGMALVDLEGRFTRVNPKLCEVLDRDNVAIVGQQQSEFTHVSDVHDSESLRQSVLLGERESFQSETRFKRPDGTTVWVNLTAAAVYNAAGEPEYLIEIIEDITPRRQVQIALQKNEERLAQTIEATGAGFWGMDVETGIVSFSDHLKELSGYGRDLPDDIEAWRDLIIPEDKDLYDSRYDHWKGNTLDIDQEYRIKTATGDIRWIRSRGRMVRDNDGNILRGNGLAWDITEEKLAEENKQQLEHQLAQSQKMEAVGKLTGGVAHDFNNILTIIQGNIQLLQMAADDKDVTEQALRRATSACDRAADLTRRLLAFSRKQSLVPRDTDIGALVIGLRDLLGRTLGETIDVNVNAPIKIAFARVDPNQLENALVNLAINARDAMPEGGTLTIDVMQRQTYDVVGTGEDALDPGRYTVIEVSDTGVGMPPSVMEHVFEPFFTTKEVGAGTGLGLSMVYGFVKQSGGVTRIESTEGQGTRVAIYLPESVGDEEHKNSTRPTEVVPHAGSGTILLVEDEDQVRETARIFLERQGYAVVEAMTGSEAEHIIDGRSDIDLVFSDIVMPGGMSGIDLANILQRKRPDLPVILSTGYAEGRQDQQKALAMDCTVILKPYSFADLSAVVQKTLSARPSQTERSDPAGNVIPITSGRPV